MVEFAVPPPNSSGAVAPQTEMYAAPTLDNIKTFMNGHGSGKVSVVQGEDRAVTIASTGVNERTVGSLWSQAMDIYSKNWEAIGEVMNWIAVYVGIYGFLLYTAFTVVQVQTSDNPNKTLPTRWFVYAALGIFALFTMGEGLCKFISSGSDIFIGNDLNRLYGEFRSFLRMQNKQCVVVKINTIEIVSIFTGVGGVVMCGIAIYCMSNDYFGAGFALWMIGAYSIKLGFLGISDGYRIVVANFYFFMKEQVSQYKKFNPNLRPDARGLLEEIEKDLDGIRGRIPRPFQERRKRTI